MVDGVGTTHDVKIGDYHYLVRPGSYRKYPAQQFGPRFTTGDPDYNNLSAWQHWVQRCWVGGFGAAEWKDDAMFDEGVGVDTAQHEVMMLTRDMGPSDRATANFDLDGDPCIRFFIVFRDNLYVLQMSGTANLNKVWWYDVASGGLWVKIATFTETVMDWCEFAGYIVFAQAGGVMTRMDTNRVFTTFAKPSGITEQPYMVQGYRDRMYVGFGRNIWRLKSDFTWDGSTAFYEAPDIDFLNRAEVHQGFLYMTSHNGHILRTDGNNTFDMWQFKWPEVQIEGLQSFDGRLFIGVWENLDAATGSDAVLYQFSGSAVTELKRWGRAGYDVRPGRLRAFGGYLWFGASNLLGMGEADGFGVARYDPREDAFHMFATNVDAITYAPGAEGANNVVNDVAQAFGVGQGTCVYATVHGHGVFQIPWSHRDASRGLATYDTTAAGVAIAPGNGGWYTSSDFDAGTPGMLKLWNAITVEVDLPHASCSVVVEISTDGGETWALPGGTLAASTVSKTGPETRYVQRLMIQNAAGTDGIYAPRLKYKVTLRTSNTAYSPFLRGMTVRYLPIPEPNWEWDMTLVLSEKQQLHDGTTVTAGSGTEPSIATKLAALQASFRAQGLVHFEDIDQSEYATGDKAGVLIKAMEMRPGPLTALSDGSREYDVRISLLEMIEEYEV